MKKVGIIGSGLVGQEIGSGFIKHGFQLMIATRNVESIASWAESNGENAFLGSFSDAAKFSDFLVFAVKGTAALDVLDLCGFENLDSKTIIDTTNPISDSTPENGVLNYFTDINFSLMEMLQEKAPKANFVKCYSSVGGPHMIEPKFDEKPSLFICGDNDSAKKNVIDILDMFGWEAVDMGSSQSARAIEPLAMLWCIPGYQHNKWDHAFKLLKKWD